MATATRVSRPGRYGAKPSRFYQMAGGVEYPSVTSVLAVLNKPALLGWAAKLEREAILSAAGKLYTEVRSRQELLPTAFFLSTLSERVGKERAHEKELTKAGDIGTEVHARIEWELRNDMAWPVGEKPELFGPALVAFNAWREWRDDAELEVSRIENVVHSDTHKYAGTMDWLGYITHEGERIRVLGDWKTGRALYPEASLQNAAYVAAALELGLTEAPTHGCLVRLPKVAGDGFEVKVIPWAEQAALFGVFLNALALWRWLERQ